MKGKLYLSNTKMVYLFRQILIKTIFTNISKILVIMSINYCQNQVSGKFIQKTIFSTNDWEKNKIEMFFYFIIRSWDKRERKMLDWIILTLVYTVVARFSFHPHRVFLEIIPCLIINVKFGRVEWGNFREKITLFFVTIITRLFFGIFF